MAFGTELFRTVDLRGKTGNRLSEMQSIRTRASETAKIH